MSPCAAELIHPILPFVAFWLLLANLMVFMLFGFDKRRARQGSRRIPEKTLLL